MGPKKTSPCTKYRGLDEEIWEKFVQSRNTPEWQERRRKAKETQAKNECPHTLSHQGYNLLEKKMMEKKRKEREKAVSSDPTLILHHHHHDTRKGKRHGKKRTGIIHQSNLR